jgi:2-oxoglutarate dehydrogenase complex dehydrogenase (E1) component-like enzyme
MQLESASVSLKIYSSTPLLLQQAHLQICNSSLSEAAVLGFEYGYSLESDLALVRTQFTCFTATPSRVTLPSYVLSNRV